MVVKSSLLLMFVLSGCSATGVGESGNSTVMDGASAVLPSAAIASEKLDARYDNGRLITQVISNGCTRAEQFSISHLVSENSCVVAVRRDSPDLCKRASFALEIEIAWPIPEECQGREIVVANPSLSAD